MLELQCGCLSMNRDSRLERGPGLRAVFVCGESGCCIAPDRHFFLCARLCVRLSVYVYSCVCVLALGLQYVCVCICVAGCQSRSPLSPVSGWSFQGGWEEAAESPRAPRVTQMERSASC